MSRKLLKISYLGTDYCGWQVQPNGISVQETLQNALEKLLGERPGVSGCSRTDSKVHANEFYCHFDSNTAIPNKGIVFGLNKILPDSIAVFKCSDVPDDFHARYSSKGKTYIYKMYVSNIRNPFLLNRALCLKGNIDIMRAEEFCKFIMGKHDFASFSSAKRTVENTVRTVYDCSISKNGNNFEFSVTADGFLYNMVRILVGTMLDYSKGKISAADITSAFKSENRNLLGPTVPPYGLYLNKVLYDEEV